MARLKTPENAAHPKTHVIDRSKNLHFGCVAFSGVLSRPLGEQRAPENNTTENADSWNGRFPALSGVLRFRVCFVLLRGPVAILFISRDTLSDSIAKCFRACFPGVSHKYRAICCKMGYRTDMSV